MEKNWKLECKWGMLANFDFYLPKFYENELGSERTQADHKQK